MVHRPAGIEVVRGAIEVLKANNDSSPIMGGKVSISISAAAVSMEQENRWGRNSLNMSPSTSLAEFMLNLLPFQ